MPAAAIGVAPASTASRPGHWLNDQPRNRIIVWGGCEKEVDVVNSLAGGAGGSFANPSGPAASLKLQRFFMILSVGAIDDLKCDTLEFEIR